MVLVLTDESCFPIYRLSTYHWVVIPQPFLEPPYRDLYSLVHMYVKRWNFCMCSVSKHWTQLRNRCFMNRTRPKSLPHCRACVFRFFASGFLLAFLLLMSFLATLEAQALLPCIDFCADYLAITASVFLHYLGTSLTAILLWNWSVSVGFNVHGRFSVYTPTIPRGLWIKVVMYQ